MRNKDKFTLEYHLSEGRSRALVRKTNHTHTFMFAPANEDQRAEINSACSPDLLPGIDSIKISFLCVCFFFSIILPLLLHKILITIIVHSLPVNCSAVEYFTEPQLKPGRRKQDED